MIYLNASDVATANDKWILSSSLKLLQGIRDWANQLLS